MAGIDEKFINELKSKNNIVDVVGRYAVIKRNGSNYWACCPLPGHNEKTPSFSVNESGQFYKCFGCGKGGDVIRFIEEVESLDFLGAVKLLAENAKMEMPEDNSKDDETTKKNKEKIERLHEILNVTAHYYVDNLNSPKGEKAKAYLQKRGITNSTIKAFGLGYSLGFEELYEYLKTKGYSDQDILDSGVCQKTQRGNVIDAAAGRLIVPIINSLNKVIAFGGRVLDKKDEAFGKYKNTQDTRIWLKKRNLFAINNLKVLKNNSELPYVIMVEGYMDVIALYQAGFKNVVASMGTSLTLEQAKLLKRYTNKVVVCYDGDSAGQDATLRSLSIFENEGFEITVMSLPNGKDPDEIIRDYGVDYYQKLVDNAEPLIDFKLTALARGKNLKNVMDKRKFVSESLAVIKTVKDAFMREELLKKLRDKSGITYESLKRDLEDGVTIDTKVEESVWKNPIKSGNGDERAERFILCAVISKRNYLEDFPLEDLYFSDPVRMKIADTYVEDPDFKADKLFEVVGEEGLEELNTIMVSGDNIFNTPAEIRYFKDCVSQLYKTNLESEIKLLNEEYKKETDLEKRRQLALIISKKTSKLLEI